MDFFNVLRKFLGLSTPNSFQEYDNSRQESNYPDHYRSRKSFWSDDQPSEEEETMGFNIFSNPLEMHKFFERQVNEIVKSFGLGGEGFFDSSQPFDHTIVDEGQSENLRDRYLKPGYEQALPFNPQKKDSDVDGRVDIKDLDSVLRGNNGTMVPKSTQPKLHFYGQSVQMKTIRNSDGTIETHKVVKDQEGNEEVIITRKKGDQEYSVVTKTDREGRKEIVEHFTNMDEKDKEAFLKNNSNSKINSSPAHDWFPFDKFFK